MFSLRNKILCGYPLLSVALSISFCLPFEKVVFVCGDLVEFFCCITDNKKKMKVMKQNLKVAIALKEAIALAHFRLNKLPTLYILEDFNFRNVRLCDLDIFRKKMAKLFANSVDLIRCHILWHLIRVCTVCQLSFWGLQTKIS